MLGNLPLVATAIIPSSSVGEGDAFAISGRTSLTVVFSRPVIALGSDLDGVPLLAPGGSSTDAPFSLEVTDPASGGLPAPPVPAGKVRWVTTSIARFDADEGWPTDLHFVLRINPGLRTYDGVAVTFSVPAPSTSDGAAGPDTGEPLQGALQPRASQAFATPAVRIAGSPVVYSASALRHTGGKWQPLFAYTAAAGGSRHGQEAPPDAQVFLYLSQPVRVATVAAALQISVAADASDSVPAGAPAASLTAKACPRWAPRLAGLPLVPAATAASAGASAGGDGSDAAMSTCVQVVPKDLAVGGVYTLKLPAGARYSAASGALTADVSMTLGGLRAFEFPFSSTLIRYARYRRMRAWLRHGLTRSPGAVAADGKGLPLLQAAMSVTVEAQGASAAAQASPVPAALGSFKVELLDNATVEITGPFQPDVTYNVAFAAAPSLLDGYGLPLRAHSVRVSTSTLSPTFTAPGYGASAAFRPTASAVSPTPLSTLSVLTCGGGATSYSIARDGPAEVAVSRVPTDADAAAWATVLAARFNGNRGTAPHGTGLEGLGYNTQKLVAPTDWEPRFLTVDLAALAGGASGSSATRGAFLQVHRTGSYATRAAFLQLSNLCATFAAVPDAQVVAWVTQCDAPPAAAADAAGRVVVGAHVWVYAYQAYGSSTPSLVASGVTDAKGMAVLDLTSMLTGTTLRWHQLAAVIRSPAGDDAAVWESVPRPSLAPEPTMQGFVTPDRTIYRIGEKVALKGYVRVGNAATRT